MLKPLDRLCRRIVGVERDLARLADPASADALWKTTLREASSTSPIDRGLLFGFFSATVVMTVALPLWRRGAPVIGLAGFASDLLAAVIFGALLGTVGGLTFVALRRHRLRLQVRRGLVERGLPTCLHCGYDLTGLTEPRCPECGAAESIEQSTPIRKRMTTKCHMKPLLRLLIDVEPELERIASDVDRNRVWLEASRRVHEVRGGDLLGIAIGLPLVLYLTAQGLGKEAARWFSPASGLPPWAIRVGVTLIAFVVLVSLMAGVLRQRYRHAVREALNERGLPTCHSCGYDLTGLTEPRCPECGATAPTAPPRQ